MSLVKVYSWFGGFGEFCTIVSLIAAIVLAAVGKLTGSFASALVAINGFGIIHDQATVWQDKKDSK